MASFPLLETFLGFVVGVIAGIVILALLTSNKATKNLCPRCQNKTEEERQLKQDWENQQKGYK